jgi:predicted N-acetyltransferase YhbS
MTISEKSRGHGPGRKLLHFAIEEARRMGARHVSRIQHPGCGCDHFYEQLGFCDVRGPQHESKYMRANMSMAMPLWFVTGSGT